MKWQSVKMQRKDHIDAFGATLLVLIMLALGINQVAVKLVNDGMSPVFQAGLRSAAAAPLLFAFCLWRKIPIPVTGKILILGLITGCLFAIEFILLFQAVEFTAVARTSIFFYTMPFWVALVAHFMIPGERLTKKRVLGLLLAFAGVIIALAGSDQTAGENALLGDLMTLVAAGCWAAIALIVRLSALSTAKPAVQLLYQVTVSSFILIPLAIFLGDTLNDPTPLHWGLFAGQVIIVVCMGFLTWFWILSVYPASDMSSFSFLAPVFGVMSSWLILGEAITWTIIAALVLVGTGIVLINRR